LHCLLINYFTTLYHKQSNAKHDLNLNLKLKTKGRRDLKKCYTS